MTNYAELRAAMEAATPGPWHTNTQCPGLCCWHIFPSVPMFGACEDAPIVMGECSEADARFMTLARNALPAILAEMDALREALEKLLAGARAETAESWQCNSYHPKLIAGMDAAAAVWESQSKSEAEDRIIGLIPKEPT